jgi:hypothetical protein
MRRAAGVSPEGTLPELLPALAEDIGLGSFAEKRMSFARLAATLALFGCGSAPSPVAPAASNEPMPCPPPPGGTASVAQATESPAGDAARLESPERYVNVAQFDCFSMEETKLLESLRTWRSGGPEGSAWNAGDAPLRCAVRLSATCSGPATLRVAGNQRTLSAREVTVSVGENAFEFELSQESWGAALEDSRDRSPVPVPYTTLLLSVSGLLACQSDYGIVSHPFADAFLAGFSGGE